MASVPIPAPTWLSLLSRLGIQRFGAWALGDVVVPVALVDAASANLNVTALAPLYNTPASAGELVAPAANTRLADTGQLPAGNYTFVFTMAAGEAALFRIRRRNAADAADIYTMLQRTTAQGSSYVFQMRLTMAASERMVIENPTVGGAGVLYHAAIFAVIS